MRKLH